MKASLVAVLLAVTVGIIQYYVEVTFLERILENLSAVLATVVYLVVFTVLYVCLFLPFRYNWWMLLSLNLIKTRFGFSSHDFYSHIEKNANRQTYRQTHKVSSRYVCKEWWVLVQRRVLSPLATALWTGQIANCCACVHLCVCVCARLCMYTFFSRLLAQLCCGGRTHLYVSYMCTCVHTVYTLLSMCQQVRIKCTRVCVYLEIVSDS